MSPWSWLGLIAAATVLALIVTVVIISMWLAVKERRELRDPEQVARRHHETYLDRKPWDQLPEVDRITATERMRTALKEGTTTK